MRTKRKAFSIIELMIVVAIIGLLTAIVFPAIMRYHLYARQKSCIANLRQIDQAIQLWADESRARPTDVVTHSNVMSYLRFLPSCPSSSPVGGTFVKDYGLTFVNEEPFCIANSGLEGTPHVFVGVKVPKVSSSSGTDTGAYGGPSF